MEKKMEGVNPYHISEAWWTEACKKMKNAVVFLDNYTAECLHWSGGLIRLIKAGAKNVKDLSSFESGEDTDVKAVFLVSGPIRNTVSTIIHDIIKGSKFEYCVVISSANPGVHTFARYGGREADDSTIIAELERDILTWMGNMNYTVEIIYFPLVIAPYSENLFFMPYFSQLYPLLSSDVPRLSQKQLTRGEKVKPLETLGEVEFTNLPYEMRVLVRQWVMCIHSLLQGMNSREEIFTLGHTARILGTELDAFTPARQRRKTAKNKVSLVLVDRTLDLVEASSHGGGGTLMGRILEVLPRLPGHNIDSAINMSPLSSVNQFSEWTLVPGCLAAQKKEERATEVLNALVTTSAKETLALINKQVEEVGHSKGLIDDSTRERVTPDALKKNIQQLASDFDVFTENAALLQQGLAAVESQTSPKCTHLDQLLSMEKQITQSVGNDDETPPFSQIIQLLKTRQMHGVAIEEVLALMTYTASLGGPNILSQNEEYTLVNLLSQAIVDERDNLSDTMLELVGEEIDEVSALKTAQHIARQLNALTGVREHLNNYRHVHFPGDNSQPSVYQSLLPRLIQDCLTLPQGDVTDLEYRSAGLKDLIKTGFSLFVNVSKPMPRDAPTMIVYVVGGLSAGEVREICQKGTFKDTSCNVILATSHFTHSKDTVTKVLKNNIYLQ